MSKLSQKELLTEGFLDIVRKATGGLAKIGGAAAGATLGAAKNIAKNIITANPDTNLFASAAAGIKSGAKTGYKLTGKAVTNTLDRLKEELKNSFYDTFNFRTIKYGKEKKNEVNKKVSTIPFTAAFKNSTQPELFSAVIIKRDSDKYEIVIRDSNNNIVPPNARRNRINFDNKFNRWKIDKNISTVDYNNIKDFMKTTFEITDPTPILNAAGIPANAATITPPQLSQLKSILKSFNLVESTQVDTLNQLKLLL